MWALLAARLPYMSALAYALCGGKSFGILAIHTCMDLI